MTSCTNSKKTLPLDFPVNSLLTTRYPFITSTEQLLALKNNHIRPNIRYSPLSIGIKTRSRSKKDYLDQDKYLQENINQTASFDNLIPKNKLKSSKTLQETTEKIKRVPKAPPTLKKAAVSALGLQKTTNSKKEANELSR